MRCAACGTEPPQEAAFCEVCGAPLSRLCGSCGSSVSPHARFCGSCGVVLAGAPRQTGERPSIRISAAAPPRAFVGGRYETRELIGEGGKKRVYHAHDTLLDREVAFALIKTDGLDQVGRERVRREARAMGRLGSHQNIVSVLDLGEDQGEPYLITELMPGGDLATLLQAAPEHRLPIPQVLELGQQLCRALEHAHARDLIHRDLKPGNIWLTDDGTAKLGDFGLAVALDQTRHTQPGMMIGTVSYMAPEQATGGSVDGRSDLYALGCVLYELVCGRPPFVGDDAVAIIGQHLNTPPVAPSWHRPDLPPALEALILRLLEKDPEKRPATASEVLQALGVIDLTPVAATATDATPSPSVEPMLYRPTFVGREPERKQLEQAFDRAISGQGSLVMVVGEPGIGKTSLCEQLATYVAVRGGTALVGHCYEEGSLTLPYLPFVEAMRSYVLARDPDGLTSDLGSGGAEVARIVSEVRDRIPVPDRPPGDPEEERWRLLQAVSGFLRNASQVRPLLIVLEDLHDADRGTLDLLQHVSRNLVGARLLIVGTYRDVEVDRAHPLSSALAELRRGGSFSRIPLRGLTVDEVHRMMNLIRGQDVSWRRAEAIHRQTEGNPLFVQEVLRYLVEEGLVVREGGQWVRTDGSDPEAGIPEGLRDVIGKRLSRLGELGNRVLSVASVMGREFRLDVLERVAGLPEEELYCALDEARDRAVVEERSGPAGAVTYRFTHAFFRQTLYEELSAPRRIRLHQQVARALEEVHARRPEDHAAELAEHFSHSSDPGDLEKAIRYGELAAQRALSVYAYGEAARHLEQALEVQAVLDPDDHAKRCDLLLALGGAMLPLEDPLRVSVTVAPEAFTLAEALGDSDRAARAAIQAIESLLRSTGSMPRFADAPEFQDWAARADRCAQPGTTQRVYADIYQGLAQIGARRPTAAHVFLRRAVEGALTLNDDSVWFAAAGWAFRNLNALRDGDTVMGLAQEVLHRPRHGSRATDLGPCLYWAGLHLLGRGQREHAEKVWRELTQLAEHTQDRSLRAQSLTPAAVLAFTDGRLEEAVALFEARAATALELGVGVAAPRELSAPVLLYLGRGTEAVLEELREIYEPMPGRPDQAKAALVLALLGRHTEARAICERFGDIGSEHDETGRPILLSLFEAAILGADRETLSALLPRFAPLGNTLWISRAGAFELHYSVGRLLGTASTLLGQCEDARAFYMQALDVCARVRFRPEIAIIHVHLAELLLDHYPDERTAAIEHLDFAIGELRAMKMQPMLERALRRKLQLQGADTVSPSTSIDAVAIAVEAERPDLQTHAAPDGTVTLLFTDIEDSTGLTVRLGDQRWLEVLRAHHALVRQQVQYHGGFEVKSQGDGFMLAFGSARRALDCAVAIQQALEAGNAAHPDTPIHVRIGLHTGEALKEADDFHGKHVVLAARIANEARGGEILVSALLKELTESGGDLQFDEGRDVMLKGLDRPQQVFTVQWQ